MAHCLVDTNILLRWVQPNSPHRPQVRRALRILIERGDSLYVTAQNEVEFWSVATRSAMKGGLAIGGAEANRKLGRIERIFTLLPDNPAILPIWKLLVLSLDIKNTQVHDARLVAAMQVYHLSHILTFNTADFAVFSGIAIVDPRHI